MSNPQHRAAPGPKHRLAKGQHFILPPHVTGGVGSEVFEVTQIITQPGLPAVYNKDGSVREIGSAPFTTIRFDGVSSGAVCRLGVAELSELGWPVETAPPS